jgi:hypothetical protein
MGKTKQGIRAPKAPNAGASTLAANDHVALLVAERNLSVTRANWERDQAQAEVFRLRAAEQARSVDGKLADSYAKAQQAQDAHRRLAAQVAEAYAIDWAQVAYEPHTGALNTLPKDD